MIENKNYWLLSHFYYYWSWMSRADYLISGSDRRESWEEVIEESNRKEGLKRVIRRNDRREWSEGVIEKSDNKKFLWFFIDLVTPCSNFVLFCFNFETARATLSWWLVKSVYCSFVFIRSRPLSNSSDIFIFSNNYRFTGGTNLTICAWSFILLRMHGLNAVCLNA